MEKTFATENKNMTIEFEQKALEANKKAFKTKDSFIYVLDTNALLKIFQFSPKSLEKFKCLVETGLFWGTRQIELEFLRNKDFCSHHWLIDNAKKLSSSFNNEILTQFEEYVRNFSYLIMTEEGVSKKINRFSTSIKTISTEINKLEKKFSDEMAKKIIEDETKLISDNFNFSIHLEEADYDHLSKEYESLMNKYNKYRNEKVKYEDFYRAYVFPGMGESKVVNPEGDYFIYHELVKLAQEQNKDIIFLTDDVTKNDWLNKETGENFNHYLSVFYSLSGKSLRIQNYTNFLVQNGMDDVLLLNQFIPDMDDNFISQFLINWNEIEHMCFDISKLIYKRHFPIMILFRRLFGDKIISNDEYDMAMYVLYTRNRIIHGDSILKLTEEEKSEILDYFPKMRNILEHLNMDKVSMNDFRDKIDTNSFDLF